MICLFPKDTTDFSTNGLKVLQPIACMVKETVNDAYVLTITMPMWDTSVSEDMIIRAPTPKNGDQLFRVYASDVDVLGNNVYYAKHIFYDLLDDFIEDTRPTNAAGAAAITAILAGTAFTGSSDITAQNSATYQMINPVKAILGGNDNDDNAFVNRWGGELERDNFTVRMNQRVGADRGVTIRYRKNLTGLTVKTDLSDVVTRIYTTGRQADGQTLLKLPEKYVDSPLIGNYAAPKVKRYDYSNIQVVTAVDDDHPQIITEAQALDQLRAAAAAEFAAGADKPTVSADVEFIPLETTEEYKNLAGLEKVFLGDTVHVYHEPLGLELTSEVVSYEYDALTQQYSSVTLGTVTQSVGSAQSTVGKMATAAQKSADTAQSGVDEAKTEITQLNGQITLKADKGSLVAEINISPEAIKIKADKLELSGLVTIESAKNGDTIINGKCIRTGEIVSSDPDSSFSVDLETGDIIMKRGTFSGTIEWPSPSGGIGGRIYYENQGGLHVEASGPMSFGSSGFGFDGPVDIGKTLYTEGGIYARGQIGRSTEVGITMSDKTTRTLRFTDGILTDNDA